MARALQTLGALNLLLAGLLVLLGAPQVGPVPLDWSHSDVSLEVVPFGIDSQALLADVSMPRIVVLGFAPSLRQSPQERVSDLKPAEDPLPLVPIPDGIEKIVWELEGWMYPSRYRLTLFASGDSEIIGFPESAEGKLKPGWLQIDATQVAAGASWHVRRLRNPFVKRHPLSEEDAKHRYRTALGYGIHLLNAVGSYVHVGVSRFGASGPTAVAFFAQPRNENGNSLNYRRFLAIQKLFDDIDKDPIAPYGEYMVISTVQHGWTLQIGDDGSGALTRGAGGRYAAGWWRNLKATEWFSEGTFRYAALKQYLETNLVCDRPTPYSPEFFLGLARQRRPPRFLPNIEFSKSLFDRAADAIRLDSPIRLLYKSNPPVVVWVPQAGTDTKLLP